MNLPQTKIKKVIEKIHGIRITDPYRWLEEGNNPEVRKWVKLQNKYTRAILDKHVDREGIRRELVDFMKIDSFGVPVPRKNLYFWRERKGTQNQAPLYVKRGLRGKVRVILNPNKLSKTGIKAIDYWYPSRKGSYVAYGISEGGTEIATMYILETKTAKQLNDVIPYARYSEVAWLPDESGFYYTRYPKPGTVAKGDEFYYEKLYFHTLGSDPKKDRLVFGDGLDKKDMLGIRVSLDGKYLLIEVAKDWLKNDLYLYRTEDKKVLPLFKRLNAHFIATIHKDRVFILTDYEAPNYKIITAEVGNFPSRKSRWEEIIPEGRFPIWGFRVFEEILLVHRLVNVASELKLYGLDGKYKMKIPLPKFGSIEAISGERDGNEFFFNYESFFIPAHIYRYDIKKDKISLYRKMGLPIRKEDYILSQVWFRSKDRTKVPMFIFGKRPLRRNDNNPVVLLGYGGFGESYTPSLFRHFIPFINKGGVIAIVNIRGGGEFGRRWHEEGILDKKQNGFNDFIGAAEYLITAEYTNHDKLAIMGASNGGLLVGACMIQRPDLFKAVVCMVPLFDMVRFAKFLIAERWIYEYGDPAKEKDLLHILKWSPYHNVKSGVEYPAVLLTTGEKDFRVEPFHARKMCALLQSINKKNPVLLRVETEAGHGRGRPWNKFVEEQTDKLAFLYWQLGIGG